ncbi:hypothetical protein ACE7GA_20175 [Roseomonas sp. CCTCC AB2023176]|uniref:hypothetical protein n=1 Tax=Roseomonas sp. CCTCC AB2023176 TaxID=3342640 RepID=UPI0035D84EBD
MIRVLAVLLVLAALPLRAQSPDEVQRPEETEDVMPAGEGRTEVFGLCTACHSSAIIRRSGLSRERWDGLMDWMTEKHGMPPLEGEFRETIVNYLAQHFPPRRTPRNASNPFLQN